MTEEKFPSYFEWTYKQLPFWVIFCLWAIWTVYSSDLFSYNGIYGISIAEILGSLGATFFLTSLLFILMYGLCRNTCKKLGYLK